MCTYLCLSARLYIQKLLSFTDRLISAKLCEVKINPTRSHTSKQDIMLVANINHAHYMQYNHAQIYNTSIQQCTSYHSLTTNSFYTKEKH